MRDRPMADWLGARDVAGTTFSSPDFGIHLYPERNANDDRDNSSQSACYMKVQREKCHEH